MPARGDQGRAGSCHSCIWCEPGTRVPAGLMNPGRGGGKVSVFSSKWEDTGFLGQANPGRKTGGELVEILKDMRGTEVSGVEFLCLVGLFFCATTANFTITAGLLELSE